MTGDGTPLLSAAGILADVWPLVVCLVGLIVGVVLISDFRRG